MKKFVAVIGTALILSACSSPPEEEEVILGDPTVATSEIKPDDYAIGETAKLPGWEITIMEVEHDASDKIVPYTDNEPLGEAVLITYRARYLGAGSEEVGHPGMLNWSFLGSDLAIYETANAGTPYSTDGHPQRVTVGGTINLQEVFDVPSEVIKGGNIVLAVEDYDTYDEHFAEWVVG